MVKAKGAGFDRRSVLLQAAHLAEVEEVFREPARKHPYDKIPDLLNCQICGYGKNLTGSEQQPRGGQQ